MKRLALALAAAALGTGCMVSSSPPAPGAVDIGWSFQRYKIVSGSAVALASPYTCATTDVLGNYLVTDVVVSFDGGATFQAVPCNDGAGDGARFDGVPAGSRTVVVSARQSVGGNLVGTFSAQTTVQVGSNQLTNVSLVLDGVPGNLDVWGGLYNQDGSFLYTCDPTVPTGTFTIVDSVGATVATGSATCAAPPAGAPGGSAKWRLGVGFHGTAALDLDTYTIRMTASSNAYDTATKAVAPTCSGQAVAHASQTGDVWYPRLYDVTANSTFCP